MKMPTLPKMKMPKLPRLPKPQPKRLQATARRAAQPMMEDYDDEPTTRLSSAFIVVLILHVVAVGGIYAFNSIKAHRRGVDSGATAQVPSIKSAESTQSNASTVEKAALTNSTTAGPSGSSSQSSVTKTAPISGSRVYHVRTGDSLGKIALQNGVTIDELQEANGIKAGTDVRVGQTLNIPTPSQRQVVSPKVSAPAETKKPEATVAKKTESTPKPASATAPTAKTYTVKKGDNPVSIAKKFGISSEELLRLNKIDDPKKLRIDQVLKIPAKKE